MLDKARKELPKSVLKEAERFEVPPVKGHIEGNKTIIINFLEIAKILNRDKKHLLKYLQRELAAPATIDGQRLILGRKISSKLISGCFFTNLETETFNGSSILNFLP